MNARSLFSLLALPIVTGLAACAALAPAPIRDGVRPMTEADLRASFSRPRTTMWTGATGVRGLTRYLGDGSASAEWSAGRISGRWRIAGNRFCTTFPKMGSGTERCSLTYRTGDNAYKYYYQPDGDYGGRFSFVN